MVIDEKLKDKDLKPVRTGESRIIQNKLAEPGERGKIKATIRKEIFRKVKE